MTTTVNPSYTQSDFRWRNDDGTQATATWVAAANTNITQDASVTKRLRFLVKQTVSTANAALAKTYKLRYSQNAGAYTDVAAIGATTNPVAYASSANVTDNTATTHQIGVGTFVSGFIDNTGATGTITYTSAALSETEVEFVVTLVSSQLANGDTLDFRVYETSSTALNTYTNTARATASIPSSGTLAVTEAADTSNITGSVLVAGSLATTEAKDTASFSGRANYVDGTLAATETADATSTNVTLSEAAPFDDSGFAAVSFGSAALAGGQVAPPVSGSLAVTEAADTAALSGFVGVSGSLASTETADTVLITGSVLVAGSLATTETSDAASITGSVIVAGTLATTEVADSASITGSVIVSGTLAATEAKDTASITGSVLVSGPLATTEGDDLSAISGFIGVSGTLAANETQDTAALSGATGLSGTLAATETADAFAASGDVVDFAALAVSESPDVASFRGGVLITGTLAVTEAADLSSISGGQASSNDNAEWIIRARRRGRR